MTTFNERRRVPREPAGWHGDYLLMGRRELGWHPCSLLDISELGAALQVSGPRPAVGDQIVVLLPGFGADQPPGEVRLEARVGNVTAEPRGPIRIGVEIDSLDLEQRDALLRLLSHEPV